MKKLLLIALLMAVFVGIADPAATCCSLVITGSSASVQISTSSTPVHWIQMVAPSGNSATAYWTIGAAATTATSMTLPAGAGQFLPPKGNGGYDLAGVYVYVANGDTLRVSWDPFTIP